jgi:hypothetical protein
MSTDRESGRGNKRARVTRVLMKCFYKLLKKQGYPEIHFRNPSMRNIRSKLVAITGTGTGTCTLQKNKKMAGGTGTCELQRAMIHRRPISIISWGSSVPTMLQVPVRAHHMRPPLDPHLPTHRVPVSQPCTLSP